MGTSDHRLEEKLLGCRECLGVVPPVPSLRADDMSSGADTAVGAWEY